MGAKRTLVESHTDQCEVASAASSVRETPTAEGRAHRRVLPRPIPTHAAARVSDYAFAFELQLKAARIAPSPNRTPETMKRPVAGMLVQKTFSAAPLVWTAS